MFVQEAMTRDPLTVTPETTIKQAANILSERTISSLPVLDEHGELCGVVTEADLIRETFVSDPRSHLLPLDENDDIRSTYVEEVMTPHVVTVHEYADVAQAADLMVTSSIKCLPVVDDRRHLVGVLSRSDRVRVRARSDDVIEREVDARLVSMGHPDWLVDVTDGRVEIAGPDTSVDRSIAQIIAREIPGVVTVKVR